MRENLPFDNFVKEQFNSYTPDVPGHIWENIAAAKRQTKPKGFWMNMFMGGNILLFAIILSVGGGAAYLLLSPKTNNFSTEKHVANNEITSQKLNTSTINNSIDKDDNSISEKKQKANEVVKEKNNTTISQDQNLNSNNSPVNYNSFTSPLFINKRNTDLNKNKNITEASGKDELAVEQNSIELSNTKFNSPFRFNNARKLFINEKLNSKNIKLPECPTIESNAAGNKMYWEVYAGPDHAFDSYKSYGDTASTNYLEKRKASTKFASAFSAGVRYTKVFNNGTSVRAGVNYTQVNEKFLYFNPNEIKYVTVITTRVVIRAPGDTIYINDTLQYQQSGSRIKTTYNRYRNIDIPLVIGYELGNGRIHANINAGVIINIYSWYKGDVLDSLYQPVSITTGKGNTVYQFKNNIGVGFLGSLSVYYKITDKLHLVLEPYFRYNLSPMSKDNLNLQQKYHIAGLHAGLRFDLK